MNFSRESNNFFIQWLRSLDKIILIFLILWISFGLIFNINSTLGFTSERLYNDPNFLIKKYYLFIFTGSIIIILSSFFNESFYKKLSKFFFITSLIFLLSTLFFGIEAKGSKRWLSIFFFNFQPVELLKPSLIIFLSSIFSSNNVFISKFIWSGFISLLSVFILLLQPDYTQAILILIIWFTLIFMSGLNLFIIFSLSGLVVCVMTAILIFFKENFLYIFNRFDNWLSSTNISYQSEKSMDAIHHGGFFGKGIGEGILKEKIPEAHTDYILASISEEFGIISIILILMIVFSLFMRVFAICQTEISSFKKYTLVSLSTIILLQIFINVGVTINLLPPTGMTFSYLSYGGSSIITSSFMMGIILALTKVKN